LNNGKVLALIDWGFFGIRNRFGKIKFLSIIFHHYKITVITRGWSNKSVTYSRQCSQRILKFPSSQLTINRDDWKFGDSRSYNISIKAIARNWSPILWIQTRTLTIKDSSRSGHSSNYDHVTSILYTFN